MPSGHLLLLTRKQMPCPLPQRALDDANLLCQGCQGPGRSQYHQHWNEEPGDIQEHLLQLLLSQETNERCPQEPLPLHINLHLLASQRS